MKAAKRAAVLKLAAETNPDGTARYTIKQIAKAVGIGYGTARNLIANAKEGEKKDEQHDAS